jgi:hypothetical protein
MSKRHVIEASFVSHGGPVTGDVPDAALNAADAVMRAIGDKLEELAVIVAEEEIEKGQVLEEITIRLRAIRLTKALRYRAQATAAPGATGAPPNSMVRFGQGRQITRRFSLVI